MSLTRGRKSGKTQWNMSRRIADMTVSDIGLGCMGFSHAYGEAMEHREAVAMIRRAYEMGYTLFDTAECYTGLDAAGREAVNELPVGEALRPIRDHVVLATKCGVQHLPGRRELRDSSPASIRRSVEGSLRRLGTDRIDLYYQHRIDPRVEPEVVAETMGELMREGKIRHWGISEVGEEYLRRAHAVCPVAAVQNCYSMVERQDEALLPVLDELGIAYVSYSPLANGLLSVNFDTDFCSPLDHRTLMRQFKPEGLEVCRGLLDMLRRAAAELGATPAQVALAWLLAKRPYIIPIPGSRKESRLRENIGAVSLHLPPDAVAALDAALRTFDLTPVGGSPRAADSEMRS